MFPDFRPDVRPAILSSRARQRLTADGYIEKILEDPEDPTLSARILVPQSAEPVDDGRDLIVTPNTRELGSFRVDDPSITIHAIGRKVDFDCLPGDFAELLVPHAKVVGQSYAEHKSGIWFGERLAFGGRDLIAVGAYRCGGAIVALHSTVPRAQAKRARHTIEAVAGGLKFAHPDPDVLTEHVVVVALPFGLALPVGTEKHGDEGSYSLMLPPQGGGAVLTVSQRQGRPMAVLGQLMSELPQLGYKLETGGFSGVTSWPWLPESRDRLHMRVTHAVDRNGRPIEVVLAAGAQGGVGVAFTARFVRRTDDPEGWLRARAATMLALSTMRVGRAASRPGQGRSATRPGMMREKSKSGVTKVGRGRSREITQPGTKPGTKPGPKERTQKVSGPVAGPKGQERTRRESNPRAITEKTSRKAVARRPAAPEDRKKTQKTGPSPALGEDPERTRKVNTPGKKK